MGQETARTGQNSRIESQLDRIEQNTKAITDQMPGLRERPPPVPRKDDDGSPPSSPSSTTSTARPVTPPPYMSADSIQRQFDDVRNMLGSLIGRTNDIADQVARARAYESPIPRRSELERIEDLLKRTLSRLGDREFDAASEFAPGKTPMSQHSKAPSSIKTVTGSLYAGSNGVYSDDAGSKIKVPANSFHEDYDPRRRRWSTVPDSLLDGELPSPDFDADFHIANLPPDTPPEEFPLGQVEVPDFIRGAPRRVDGPPEPYRSEHDRSEYAPTPGQQAPQPLSKTPSSASPSSQSPMQGMRDEPPIPFRMEEVPEDQQSYYTEEETPREPSRQLPPPQPVDLPTPVRSPGHLPPPGPSGMGMRPPFAPGMPGPMGMLPPPGATEMPRPTLPRIAGVRDPISTT